MIKRQTVTVLNHQTNQTFEESYDTLILSPGASANRLNTHSDISFTVRNLEDTEAIDTFITNTKAQCTCCWRGVHLFRNS